MSAEYVKTAVINNTKAMVSTLNYNKQVCFWAVVILCFSHILALAIVYTVMHIAYPTFYVKSQNESSKAAVENGSLNFPGLFAFLQDSNHSNEPETVVKNVKWINSSISPFLLNLFKNNIAPTARPEQCEDCNMHNYSYVENPTNLCDNTSNPVDIIIAIMTQAERRPRRDAIRNTWASVSHGNTARLRYTFLLGVEPNADEKLLSQIKEESLTYKDILQEDFVDSYRNLTLKTIMALKWGINFCSSAKYILKTDDDMFINPKALLTFIDNLSPNDKGIYGYCFKDAGPIRDKTSKWHVSLLEYPQPKYPGFCAGPGYVLPMTVAREIVSISPNVPYFHLEDVYMSICMSKLGYPLKDTPGFFNYKKEFLCTAEVENAKFVITSHEWSPEALQNIWNACKEYISL